MGPIFEGKKVLLPDWFYVIWQFGKMRLGSPQSRDRSNAVWLRNQALDARTALEGEPPFVWHAGARYHVSEPQGLAPFDLSN